MAFVEYIAIEILKAACFLAVLLLPGILAAWLMNSVSDSIRKRLRFFGDRTFIYLTAPGVAVHELGHAVFCPVFGHKIVKMNLFSPENDGTLGFVRHQYNPRSLYQRVGNFFISTGPIWGGLFVLYLSSGLVLPEEAFSQEGSIGEHFTAFFNVFFNADSWRSVPFYVWLYLSLTISAHITLSPADVKGAKDGFIFLAGIVVLSFLLFGWCGSWEEYLVEQLALVFGQLFSLVAINFLALLIIAILLKLIPTSVK